MRTFGSSGKRKKIVLSRKKENQVLERGNESEMSKLRLQMSEELEDPLRGRGQQV